ncbi:DUF6093 family protein [Streptomyces xanthochromogenes]|uniref:DUF6093 family protein n=1 Tax=Streptomyces xanthochromogenes TaxID=67384 RepID=UPI00343CC0F2
MPNLDKALAVAAGLIENLVLRDTVRITLPATGGPVLNPDTGDLEYPAGAVLYEGMGAVQAEAAQAQLSGALDSTQPWVQETSSRYRLLTPLSAPVAPKDAQITVTAVHDPANTALIGRTWVSGDPGRASTLEAVRVTPLDQNRKAE